MPELETKAQTSNVGDLADGIAEAWLFETWAQRERASFKLPPSRLALEPADMIALDQGR